MERCIHAYTELNVGVPAYISFNERDGKLELTVRSRGGPSASIEVTPEQIRAFAEDVLEKVPLPGLYAFLKSERPAS